jgi:hypothetical protein
LPASLSEKQTSPALPSDTDLGFLDFSPIDMRVIAAVGSRHGVIAARLGFLYGID